MYIFSKHQKKQEEVINLIEKQVNNRNLKFSTVPPVENYQEDKRICLTSVHFPHKQLISKIQNEIIKPLEKIEPEFFYYPQQSIHMTLKNIRVINNPPRFTQEDVQKAKSVFDMIIPTHKKFKVYFYRLLIFPNNIALIGTTEAELDNIVLDLDNKLNKIGLPDDKKYVNQKYFFSNITLLRFNRKPSKEFIKKVNELSKNISFKPYIVDSVTLVSGTAVLTQKNIIKTWQLKN